MLCPLDVTSPSPRSYVVNPWPTLPWPSAVTAACWAGVWGNGMCGHQRALRVGFDGMWILAESQIPKGERRKHRMSQRGREGGRGWGFLGVGSRHCVCVCRNPVYKFLDSVGLTDASGVCLAPGFITVAVRCSSLWRSCGGVQPVGSMPDASGRVHLPGSASCQERWPKSKLQWHSQPVTALSGCSRQSWVSFSGCPSWKEAVFRCRGSPPDSKPAGLLPCAKRVDKEMRGNRRRKWGERNRTQGGSLHHAVLGCPRPGTALERCSGYMASFSLWEHLLSFISVSWIYRITLVSVRREIHLREQLVRGLGVYRGSDRSWICRSRTGQAHSAKVQGDREGNQSAVPLLPCLHGDKSPWPRGQMGRRGQEQEFLPLFLCSSNPSGPQSA